MIEIKCSKAQKRKMIDALARVCLFPRRQPFCAFDKDMTCEKCLEKNIKWEVTNEPKK